MTHITDSFEDIIGNYNPKANISKNILTKFEVAKIVGMRLEQLARGADPYIEVKNLTDIRSIVIKELKEKKIPYIISRSLPNGVKEYWKLADMNIII